MSIILFFVLSLFLVNFSLFRPQWGYKKITIEENGVDIVFVLDVSKSMKAIDMSVGDRQVDRLSAAKEMIGNFVMRNEQNRYSLIIFAGEAFVSTPLTFDTDAFLTFLDGVDHESVGQQGTNLNDAIVESIARFVIKGNEEDRGKAIVLISDGGDEMDGNFGDLLDIVKENKIKIFTIGVGSKNGVPIPEGRDFFGRIIYKTYEGKRVLVKLNDKPLKEIADSVGGEFFYAKHVTDLEVVSKKLEGLELTVLTKEKKDRGEDRYQYFVFIAFILFIAFIFTKPKNIKNKKILKIQIFLKKIKIFSLILFIFILSGCDINTLSRYHLKKGNEDAIKSYVSEAKDRYEKASKTSKELEYVAQNNKGILDYERNLFSSTKDNYEKLASVCDLEKKEYCDQIYYNLGNTYYRLGEEKEVRNKKIELWQNAINSYKKSLEINASDKQAQENIDFITKKMQEEQQKPNDQNKQDQKNQNGSKSKEQQDKKSDGEEEKGENGKQDNRGGNEKQSALSPQQNRELDDYSKKIEQKQQNLKKYFNQKKLEKNDSGDPFNSLFNDPFFNNFFGNKNFRDQNNNSKKDW